MLTRSSSFSDADSLVGHFGERVTRRLPLSRQMNPQQTVSWLSCCMFGLVIFGGSFSPRAAESAQTSDFNRVYNALKEARREAVERYAVELLQVAEDAANAGFDDVCRRALRQVRTLLRRPEDRRRNSGVDAPRLRRSADESTFAKRIHRRLRRLKRQLGRTPTEKGATRDERYGATQPFVDKLERARRRFVKSLSSLANRCVRHGFPAHGYEVVLWTLRFDPENSRLRKTMRQQEFVDPKSGEIRWYGPFDFSRASRGMVDHPRYGWVTADQQQQLEKGLSWHNGAWHPSAEVDAKRRQWKHRWTHETEHFIVHTNAPIEDAVSFGREVEQLYSFVFRVWVEFFAFDDAQAAKDLILRGGKELGARKLFLNYFRSRESYVDAIENDAALRSQDGATLLKDSAGFYSSATGRAYFFRGLDGPQLRTIYHEVTHQIFGETFARGHAPTWLAEGIAVFMEDPIIRGQRGAQRLLAGAQAPRGLREHPIDVNVFLRTRNDPSVFHAAERRENYSTAGAVVHFFLLHKGGVYRRGFIRYAREAYRNTRQESPTPVAKLYEYLGTSAEMLQEAWSDFNRTPDLFDF